LGAVLVVLLVVATLVVGGLIGSVGIGGVLLTPALTYFAGVDVHVAMATSMWAFVFTGIAGTATYARRGSLEWGPGARVCVGAIPGALVGAWANGLLSDGSLKLILAVLLIATGLYAVAGAHDGRARRELGTPAIVGVGLGVGFGSALTGTGGPVLVVPTLLLLGVPALTTVGIGNLVQLPVAGFGTLGFLIAGEVDLLLGLGLGLLAALGVLVGARIAHAAPAARLRRVVAVACIAAGLAIALDAAVGGS
jgi:uncharacterized membrane protein YfcA